MLIGSHTSTKAALSLSSSCTYRYATLEQKLQLKKDRPCRRCRTKSYCFLLAKVFFFSHFEYFCNTRNIKSHFPFTCSGPILPVLQTQNIAYNPASNKSRTWIEAAPKSWKITHNPRLLYKTLRYIKMILWTLAWPLREFLFLPQNKKTSFSLRRFDQHCPDLSQGTCKKSEQTRSNRRSWKLVCWCRGRVESMSWAISSKI